jgi:energy-coupling factor transporter transmembrane protein EcfT
MWIEKINERNPNPICALYPKTKIFIVFCSMISIFLLSSMKIDGYTFLLIPFLLVITILVAFSQVSKEFWKLMKPIVFLSFFIFIVQILSIRRGDILAKIWIINVHEEGVQQGLRLCFSIIDVAGILLWYFRVTPNKETARAFQDSGMSNKTSYVFISTFKIVSELSAKSKVIMNAQRARGVETEGNLMVRMKAFFPTIVPLVLSSLMNAEERALTLDCKGFETDCNKTHLFYLEKTKYEIVGYIVPILFTTILIIIKVLLWKNY